jgi:UDP-2,3-diacylglucosamine pyrophosphatase LpxH
MAGLNTLVQEEHLCIISDLHLGNPTFVQGDNLDSFLRYLAKNNSSLCINGDGIDLVQLSIPKLTRDIHSILKGLRDFFAHEQKKIYYVIGNHDIYMEAFLEDSGIFNVVPFLDVVSGNRRIHIEHGHLYDNLFLNFPRLYTQAARLLGLWVKLSPAFFHLWFKTSDFFLGLRNRLLMRLPYAPLDDLAFMKAAQEFFNRGFDAVVFGHTHHFGVQELANSKKYANAGSWAHETAHYLTVDQGEIILKEWVLSGAHPSPADSSRP